MQTKSKSWSISSMHESRSFKNSVRVEYHFYIYFYLSDSLIRHMMPGGEGTSGVNSGWASILGSSSWDSSEASVNQPTGSSNQSG